MAPFQALAHLPNARHICQSLFPQTSIRVHLWEEITGTRTPLAATHGSLILITALPLKSSYSMNEEVVIPDMVYTTRGTVGVGTPRKPRSEALNGNPVKQLDLTLMIWVSMCRLWAVFYYDGCFQECTRARRSVKLPNRRPNLEAVAGALTASSNRCHLRTWNLDQQAQRALWNRRESSTAAP